MLSDITQQDLLDLLDYDPDTGQLVWKPRPRGVFLSDQEYRRFNTRYAGSVAGTASVGGYVKVFVKGRVRAAHRLVWCIVYGAFPEGDIDHINGVKTDNRLANLRACSASQNMQCSRGWPNRSTGVRGVSRKSRGSWVARIRVGGVLLHLGSFPTVQQASEAYARAAVRHFKEFAPASARAVLEGSV